MTIEKVLKEEKGTALLFIALSDSGRRFLILNELNGEFLCTAISLTDIISLLKNKTTVYDYLHSKPYLTLLNYRNGRYQEKEALKWDRINDSVLPSPDALIGNKDLLDYYNKLKRKK